MRVTLGGYAYHMLNRGNGRLRLFHKKTTRPSGLTQEDGTIIVAPTKEITKQMIMDIINAAVKSKEINNPLDTGFRLVYPKKQP